MTVFGADQIKLNASRLGCELQNVIFKIAWQDVKNEKVERY